MARPACAEIGEGCPDGPGRSSTHRGRAMRRCGEVFVGIDTAKAKNAVAIAEAGRQGEIRYLGEFANTPDAVAKLVRKLADRYETLHFCYEAGPTGYGLYRQIVAMGHSCTVVAPSLIPRRPGERVKTNRRDALSLARPSVPMKMRHRLAGKLDLRARKDHLAHAHAADTDRCRGRRCHERRP